jgi:hypothetical protein
MGSIDAGSLKLKLESCDENPRMTICINILFLTIIKYNGRHDRMCRRGSLIIKGSCHNGEVVQRHCNLTHWNSIRLFLSVENWVFGQGFLQDLTRA